MRKDYTQLLKDTIDFLKQEDIKLSPPQLLPVKPKEAKVKPPAEKIAPTPQRKSFAPTSHLILDKIQKHLPHLKLISSPPQCVALMGDKSEPFFQNLAKAIEERFCSVEWVNEGKDLTYFTLILGTIPLNISHQILLEPIENYHNNPSKKKKLWAQICHHLSQRSS